MKEHIEQALSNFRSNAARYSTAERYYRGDHNLAFATEKFANAFGSLFREFALNLCPAICDAIRDKLRVTGFSVESAGVQSSNFNWPSDLNQHIDRIWQRNRMAIRAGEVHKDAVRNGDAYAIAWPGADGRVSIYPNRSSACTVAYDEESPGRILWAAKFWRPADARTRLNLFYPDRIERYVTRTTCEAAFPAAGEFVPHAGDAPHISDNPFGVVPVFHFANNADIGSFGRSELEAAIPVQDGLNKSVLDMLVAMEFSAFRQRWAAGIEVKQTKEGKAEEPFRSGPGNLWISNSPNARFGDFPSADLDQFLKVKDGFRIDVASVTGTPLYYLLPHTRGFPSGESLRKSESRFIAKVRDRQAAFGQTWADLMSFALMAEGYGSGIRLITRWEDPGRVSERELLENILLKKQIGISDVQALREAGYGDADIESMV
jgi:hypothetical protein